MHRIITSSGLSLFLLLGGHAHAAAQAPADVEADAVVLRAAGVATDGPALADYLRGQSPTPDHEKQVALLLPQLGDKTFRVREKAAAGLIALGPAALPGLRKAANTGELETRRRAEQCIERIEAKFSPAVAAAAIRVLAVRRPEGASALLLDFMPSANEQVAEEVTHALLRLASPGTEAEAVLQALFGFGRAPKVEPVVFKSLKSPEPARVAAAALVVGRFGTAEQRRQLAPLLTDDHPRVRLAAAQGLLGAGERAAVTALIELLTAAPLPQAREAEESLAELAGASAPKTRLGEDAKTRAAAQEAWRRWLQDKGEAFRPPTSPAGAALVSGGQRARRLVAHFLELIRKSDVQQIKKIVDIPFVLDPIMALEDRAQLDQMIEGMRNEKDFTAEIKGVERLGQFLQQKRRAEGHVKKLDVARTWVVHMRIREGGQMEMQVGLLVRVRGSEARWVGMMLPEDLLKK